MVAFFDTVAQFGPYTPVAVIGYCLAVWIKTRADRRVSYEYRDLKIQAPTAQEIDLLRRKNPE